MDPLQSNDPWRSYIAGGPSTFQGVTTRPMSFSPPGNVQDPSVCQAGYHRLAVRVTPHYEGMLDHKVRLLGVAALANLQ